MKVLRRFVSEPLVQFLIIGVVVFGVYSLADRSPPSADTQAIDIGPGRIAQLYETFSRTWQRPPTMEEMNGLINSFVKEEIFYREGRKMGLDRDDTVFRRRLQQKMEFLMEPSEAELDVTDDELGAFLTENAAAFRIRARIAFRQVFVDPVRRGETAQKDAEMLLAALERGDSATGLAEAGDPTQLPHAMPLMPADQIERDFGSQFVKNLQDAAPGQWTGPLTSTFGLHLVYVEQSVPARDPGLNEARDLVLREWLSRKRRAIAEERYQALRRNYKVTITPPTAQPANGAAAAAK